MWSTSALAALTTWTSHLWRRYLSQNIPSTGHLALDKAWKAAFLAKSFYSLMQLWISGDRYTAQMVDLGLMNGFQAIILAC